MPCLPCLPTFSLHVYKMKSIKKAFANKCSVASKAAFIIAREIQSFRLPATPSQPSKPLFILFISWGHTTSPGAHHRDPGLITKNITAHGTHVTVSGDTLLSCGSAIASSPFPHHLPVENLMTYSRAHLHTRNPRPSPTPTVLIRFCQHHPLLILGAGEPHRSSQESTR